MLMPNQLGTNDISPDNHHHCQNAHAIIAITTTIYQLPMATLVRGPIATRVTSPDYHDCHQCHHNHCHHDHHHIATYSNICKGSDGNESDFAWKLFCDPRHCLPSQFVCKEMVMMMMMVIIVIMFD